MKKLLVLCILLGAFPLALFGQPDIQQLKTLYENQKNIPLNDLQKNKNQEIERDRGGEKEKGKEDVAQEALKEAAADGRKQVDTTVYGRDIFSLENVTFAPSTSIPTPANYILAAGDQIILDVWGEAQESFSQKISPDGNINISGVGPIQLSGMTILQAENVIRTRMSRKIESLAYGGSNLKVTLGNIRTIQVNIIGEAAVPGTYTLPSFATLFNALYMAGGVSSIGSLREIKLYRNGKEEAVLDVYDYLLHGNQNVDIRLNDNDLIIVSPYKNIVSVSGKVKRPHNYELKQGQTLANLVETAGGFRGDAYSEEVNVVRKSGKQYQLFTVAKENFSSFALFDKDEVTVGDISREFANRVVVSGAVWRPGPYQLSKANATALDLLKSAGGLRDDAFAGRANIFRTHPDKSRELLSLNLKEMLKGSLPDVMLQKDDSLHIETYQNLEEEKQVRITGEVKNDTTHYYKYYEGVTVEDMIIMAGGLKESASLARLEVSRRIKDPMSLVVSERRAEVFSYNIPQDLSLDPSVKKFVLQPYDEVYVRRSPGYIVQEHVRVNGQVQFPGEYTLLLDNERLSDLVLKTGGATKYAYIKGANLHRKLTSSDVERIRSIRKLSDALLTDSIMVDIAKVGDYYSVGIDLESAMKNPGGQDDIVLKPGDILTIPSYNNTIKISGAVNYETTTTYMPKANLAKYISEAGGFAKGARKNKVFVIYMNGKVETSTWSKYPKIEPGCEIVVPQKPLRNPTTIGEVVGVSSSIISLMAIIATFLK